MRSIKRPRCKGGLGRPVVALDVRAPSTCLANSSVSSSTGSSQGLGGAARVSSLVAVLSVGDDLARSCRKTAGVKSCTDASRSADGSL